MLAHISFTKAAVEMEDISFIACVPFSISVSKKQQLTKIGRGRPESDRLICFSSFLS